MNIYQMSNYKNAYTEVYTILQYLDDEEYNKIPKDVIDAIAENRNKEYHYEMNEGIILEKHPMLKETRAILFNLFRDYLSTPQQKEKILKMQAEERKKLEKEKSMKFKSRDIFQNEKNSTSNQIEKQNEEKEKIENKSVQLIEYKENLFIKIINKFKNWIKR